MITMSTLTECLFKDLGGDFRGKHLWESSSVEDAAKGLLQDSFLKKYASTKTGTTPEQDQAALEKFLKCNVHCRDYTVRCNSSWEEELYGTFKTELYNFFYPRGNPLLESLDQIFDHGRNGPGAAIGSSHGSNYSKLWASRLTTSSLLLEKHFRQRLRHYPRWDAAENFRQSTIGDPYIVNSSRLSFVPKNDKISRTTCTEPVLNMYYQLGIGDLLRSRLAQVFGIVLETQPDVNRDLAKVGSIDGSISTIDLESASDTISLNLLKDCFPREQLAWFLACRSKFTLIRGEEHELHMVSSMGNGFTFQLQTAIFACAVRAVYRTMGIWKRVSVFGDDIICVKQAYPRLVQFLTFLGFKVNAQKSFSEGPFRESCGHDCFKGRNVRGVYVKALSNPAQIYVAINRLIEWSTEFWVELPLTLRYLMSHVPRLLVVPYHSDMASGVRLPLSLARKEIRKNRNGSWQYKSLEWVPTRMSIHAGRIPGSRRRIVYNPDGLVLSTLIGESAASFLTSRDVGRWKTKRRVTPSWDNPYESRFEAEWGSSYLGMIFQWLVKNK
jgi:hypothetical protein